MIAPSKDWRFVKHPALICVLKGWRWGWRCLISPRGTVFETRRTRRGLIARPYRDFQLKAEN